MSSRIIDRMKYICRKAVDRTKDSFFNFTHAQLIRNMVTASELDLVKREPCDRDLVLIAFYPTGGFGDYIISSKLLDELLLSVPCRIDVYCESTVFGNAIYGARPGVTVLPYESMYGNRMIYDVALRVEHFVHVLSWNAHHVAKICPEFSDVIRALGKSMKNVRPAIEEQWFREAMHFKRCRILGINRWSELRHGDVFRIPDQYTYIDLKPEYRNRLQELNLRDCRYITVNRGADSMGRQAMQTKVWPQQHYEQLVLLLKQKYPDIRVVQLGTAKNAKISDADVYVLGESMEATKWILRGSMLHIDCEGGLVHLAVQMAVTCVVLFGPTPAHMYAYPANINLVAKTCSNCMGTHKDWAFSCYQGVKDPVCMHSLTAGIVMEQIGQFLDKKIRQKEIVEDAWMDTPRQDAAIRQIYEQCRKKNKQLTMQEKHLSLYAKVAAWMAQSSGKQNAAVVNAKRDFTGWYLAGAGAAVTEFDRDYGYCGEKGDTGFNKFTKCCMEYGMDMRLGDGYNLPYASESFDIVIWLKDSAAEEMDQREVRRILKNHGVLMIG